VDALRSLSTWKPVLLEFHVGGFMEQNSLHTLLAHPAAAHNNKQKLKHTKNNKKTTTQHIKKQYKKENQITTTTNKQHTKCKFEK
jgi:hypothetical protein